MFSALFPTRYSLAIAGASAEAQFFDCLTLANPHYAPPAIMFAPLWASG
jgi:hypothetical protein